MKSEGASKANLTESTEGGPLGPRAIRSLLNRHGVASSRHVTLVAEILGFGYTPVHRRMKGEVAWELEEIQKVAAHFGESLASVFAPGLVEESVSALLLVNDARIPCLLLPGRVVRDSRPNSLVAVEVGSQWFVASPAQAGAGPWYEVQSLQIAREADRASRIAILDDDPDEAAGIAEYFLGQNCEAHSFTDVATLIAHMKLRPFDAFVIDWVLDEGSALELVGMIRADDRDCPIAILSGKVEADVSVESAVAEALSTYKLMFFQKPTRLALIASQLLRALAAR